MAIGEKIQRYRKSLGMSQEELGQKLLVSRQTISLWEKGQTVPTFDNLMRLKEIFGVTADELLDTAEDSAAVSPKETYRFQFSAKEVDEIYKLQRNAFHMRPVFLLLFLLILLVVCFASRVHEFPTGFICALFLLVAFAHIRGSITFAKNWKENRAKIGASVYDYEVFDSYIRVLIYRNGEKCRESRCSFSDIELIQQTDTHLFLQFGGQFYILRRSDLKEDSFFYSYMHINPGKIIEKPKTDRWRVLSLVFFVLSLLSILGALITVSSVSNFNGLFLENMWLFYLWTPLPAASVFIGCIVKRKGYPYKKNVIAGSIMFVLLCLYGSFGFMI